MSEATIGGEPVLRGYLTLPRRGAWIGDFALDGEIAPTGTVDLVILGLTLRGTILRSGAPYLQPRVRMVGGNGALARSVEAKDYRSTAFGQIVRELLQDAGETVAEDVLVGGTDILDKWTRTTGVAALELDRLCDTRIDGTTWRVRNDGAIEVRPLVERQNDRDYILLAEWPQEKRALFGLEDESVGLDLLPGDRLPGGLVDSVVARMDPKQFRVEVYYA